MDANSAVNSLDLMIVAQKFLQSGKPSLDINKDGAINSLGLQIIARNFNPVPCGAPD